MNSRQKKVLLVGAALVALMLLFPPWDYFDSDSSMRKLDGYHLLFAPPSRENIKAIFAPDQVRYPESVRIEVDRVRLSVQCLSATTFVLGLFLALGTTRSIWKFVFSAVMFAVASVAFIFYAVLSSF